MKINALLETKIFLFLELGSCPSHYLVYDFVDVLGL